MGKHDMNSVCKACQTQCVPDLRIAKPGPSKHSIHKVTHSTAPKQNTSNTQVAGCWLAKHTSQHFLTMLRPTSDVWCNIHSAAVHAQLEVHCSWQRNARGAPENIPNTVMLKPQVHLTILVWRYQSDKTTVSTPDACRSIASQVAFKSPSQAYLQ
jgi:hypothetical protein